MASSAIGMTTRRGTKRKSSGDTIEVKQKTSTITISDNSENEAVGGRSMRSTTRKSASAGGANRPWARDGKVSSHDLKSSLDAKNILRHQFKHQLRHPPRLFSRQFNKMRPLNLGTMTG